MSDNPKRACRKCIAYARKRMLKCKGETVFVMKDSDNVLFTYDDYKCLRCGLYVRDIPGVKIVEAV